MTYETVHAIGTTPATHAQGRTFGTFDDARREIIRLMLWMADGADNEGDAENLTSAAEDANLWGGPDALSVNGQFFAVRPTAVEDNYCPRCDLLWDQHFPGCARAFA